jgi:hypothetical protein
MVAKSCIIVELTSHVGSGVARDVKLMARI